MKILALSILCAVAIVDLGAAEMKTADDFRAAAEKANAVLTVPEWEQTQGAVEKAMNDAIATANKALDQIGQQDLNNVTFQSTVGALDDLTYKANLKAFADTHPQLSGEDEKLLFETMRDYRRAGLELPPDKRREVEQLRKELAKLGTDFDSNIVNTKAPVIFTKNELNGVPESLLNAPGVKTGDNTYTVLANVTWQFVAVQENAKSEATRKSLYVVHDSLAKDTNVALLNKMLELRNNIALRLGYKSWDDYQTETRMAKTGAGAKSYIDNLIAGIQPKFDAELAILQKMKAADTTFFRSKKCSRACSTFTRASSD